MRRATWVAVVGKNQTVVPLSKPLSGSTDTPRLFYNDTLLAEEILKKY